MFSEVNEMVVGAAHTPPAPSFCPHGQLYTVLAGDSLFLIAQRFGICLQQLIEANPQIENPNNIFPGQLICIPVPTFPPCPGEIYIVVQGDTLFKIAQRFGVTLEALLAANPEIVNPDLIFPGQKICIPIVGTPPCATGFTYVVAPGDTIYLIAERLGVTVDSILSLNPQITDPNSLRVGELLCLPLPVSIIAPIGEEPVIPQLPISPVMPGPMPCPPREPVTMPLPDLEPSVPSRPPLPIMPGPLPCPPVEDRPYPCPPAQPIVRPLPCPPGGEVAYPSPPGAPTPYPYYPGSFVYATPPVKWEECPYARSRKRRRRLQRRRRMF